jgi:hypothetical protein
MVKANYSDKKLVTDLLSRAFDTNVSVNFLVKQDSKRQARIRFLMDYAFETCMATGEVLWSDDKKACALIQYPDQKKTSAKSIWLNLQLLFKSIGLLRMGQILNREKVLKKNAPPASALYLWFIGVDPSAQGKGVGSAFVQEIIDKSVAMQRPIYLETSMVQNVPFYQKLGFEKYDEIREPHTLFFIRRKLVENH